MGIRGLATRARNFEKKGSIKDIAGAVFYVDFPNILHSVTDNMNLKYSRSTFLSDFRRLWADQVKYLISMNPKKIVFVEDGYVPESKEAVRLERKTLKLRNIVQETPQCDQYLAIEYLNSLSKLGIVETLCCGNEADDEIIRLIVEESEKEEYASSSFYIFSGDSDFFTFKLPDQLAKRVYVVQKLETNREEIYSINLHTAQERVVSKQELTELPSDPPGKSIWNPKPAEPYVLNQFNHAYVHSRFSLLLLPVWVPNKYRSPNVHEIVFPLLSVFHGVFMEKYFPDKSEPLEVWVPGSDFFRKRSIPFVKGKPIHDATKDLMEKPLWETVISQFENITDVVFKPHEIKAVGAYVRALVEEKHIRKIPTVTNADLLDSYLKALCILFIYFEGLLDGFFSHHLLWKLCPFQLSSFLEDLATEELTSQLGNLKVKEEPK